MKRITGMVERLIFFVYYLIYALLERKMRKKAYIKKEVHGVVT